MPETVVATPKLTRWIRLMAAPADVDTLATIAEQDGDASLSATVRKLIREEAKRRRLPTLNGR